MRILKVLTLAALFWSMTAAVAGKIAAVHCDTPTSFWQEVNILRTESELDWFKITELEQVMSKLAGYDILIIGTQANNKYNIDFGKYAPRLRNFLENGGILLILDANYSSMTDSIIKDIAPVGNTLGHNWGCANAEFVGSVVPQAAAGALFNYPFVGGSDDFPLNLQGGHLINLPRGWKKLAVCRHKHGVIVEYPIGEGKIIATPLFALFSANGKRFLRSFVLNLRFQQQCRKAGLEIMDFTTLYSSGKNVTKLTLRNPKKNTVALKGRIVFGNNILPVQEVNLQLAPQESHTLTYDLPERAEVTAGVTFTEPSHISFTGRFAPPDMRPEWHLAGRIFSARTKNFTFPVFHKQKGAFTAAEIIVDGQIVIPCQLDSAEAKQLTADLSGIAPGVHTLQLRLYSQDKSSILLDGVESDFTPDEMKLNIDSRGNFIRNGKPFFPIALYHVSRAKGVTAENRLECLRYAAEYGFNMLFAATIGDPADDIFMAEAEKLGIGIFCDVLNVKTIAEKKDRWKAVISWMHELDEPEHWGYTPSDVRKRVRQITALDPACPVFSSMETALTVRRYAGVCDIIATHGYPVPSHELSLVSDKLRLLTDLAGQYMFVPVGTVQCFGYPDYPPAGYPGMPTARQVRNMVFQALAANIRGLNFYTYADGGFYLRKNPELDKLMQNITAEIRCFIPYIQNGTYRRLNSGNKKIYGARWKLDNGKMLQVWINTDKKNQTLFKPQKINGMRPVMQSRNFANYNKINMKPEEIIVWQK